MQERLVASATGPALRALSKNPAAAPAVLHALSQQEEDQHVLIHIAWNDNTADATLQALTEVRVPWFARFSATRRLANAAGGTAQLPEVTLDDLDLSL